MDTSKDNCKYIIYFTENSIKAIRIESKESKEIEDIIRQELGDTVVAGYCEKDSVAILSRIIVPSDDHQEVYLNFYPGDTVIRQDTILCGCKGKLNDKPVCDFYSENLQFKGLNIEEIGHIFNHSFVNYRKMVQIDWFCRTLGIKLQVNK